MLQHLVLMALTSDEVQIVLDYCWIKKFWCSMWSKKAFSKLGLPKALGSCGHNSCRWALGNLGNFSKRVCQQSCPYIRLYSKSEVNIWYFLVDCASMFKWIPVTLLNGLVWPQFVHTLYLLRGLLNVQSHLQSQDIFCSLVQSLVLLMLCNVCHQGCSFVSAVSFRMMDSACSCFCCRSLYAWLSTGMPPDHGQVSI